MRIRLLAVPLALLVGVTVVSCGGDDSATGPCQYSDPQGRPVAKKVDPPPSDPTVSGEVPVTIATSAGDIGVTLDAGAAPCTVNSFLSLADQGYYDDSPCTRLTTAGIFVLQCGDPSGVGSGGPGYIFPDELNGDETYPAGTLAMANGGPDTNGSQFFLVYDDTQLQPDYTVFGKIDRAGLRVLEGVAAKGTADGSFDGPPQEQVQIESVTRN